MLDADFGGWVLGWSPYAQKEEFTFTIIREKERESMKNRNNRVYSGFFVDCYNLVGP